MKRILVLALALLAATPVQAQSPLPTSGDVDLSVLAIDRLPTAGVANVVIATVFNNATQPMYATVQFTYDDGAPLMGAPGVGDTNGRTIPANSKATINLSWVPDAERPGRQVVRAVLRAQGDTDGSNNEKAIETFVRAPAVNVTLEEPRRVNLSAGSTGFLRYTVRNDGNAPDTFLVEVQGNASWTPRMVGQTDLLILPGQSRTGEVAYTAPATGNDYNLTVTVRASSTQRANATASVTSVMLNSNLTYAPVPRSVQLTGLPAFGQVLPGENVTWDLTLRNNGTADDVVLVNATFDANATGWRVNLTAPANATGWNATHDVNATLTIPLSPGQTRMLRLNVTRLENASADMGNLTVLAFSNDSPLLRAIQPNAEYRARLDARLVNASPELALVGFRHPGHAYQGDELTIGVQLANLGRRAAPPSVLHLELTDGTFALRQEDRTIRELAAGEWLNVTWVTRSGDLQGEYQVRGRLLPNLTNATGGDRDPGNNEATLDLLVRRPTLEVRTPDVVDVTPGARLVLLGASTGISVVNDGPADEMVRVTLTSSVPWLAAEWTVDVPASGSRVLPLDLEVPKYPHVTTIPARVQASLASRPEFNTSVQLQFRIDDKHGPDAQVLSPTQPTTAGETTRILVRADDATGVGDASVIIATPGGERVLLTLAPNATDPTLLEAEYAPPRAGTHVLEFRLGDATSARHTTLLSNVTWVVNERPYRGFAPIDFREGSVTNRRVLRLQEVENGTTAGVEVDTGDGYRPLAFPYEVKPNGWTEGAHVLRVKARSLGGQTWTQQWNVTLDTTPPTLGNLTVNTRGGLTTVTVTATGAQDVTATFTGGEGDLETELNPGASRTFTANVRAPAGWTRVTVLATDAAGNVASLDHEANAKRTPAPGAAWGLAVLALAALALRRR